MTRWLLDTNLVVARAMGDPEVAALFVHPAVAVSPRLLAEAAGVLARPQLHRVLGWDAEAIAQRLHDWLCHAQRLDDVAEPPAWLPAAPDPGDQFLWNLLAAHADLVLVTRDKRLLKARGPLRGRVLRVQAAQARMAADAAA